MSKVEELRGKYRNVNAVAFNFFEAADTTPTKKYLDYMLKMWDGRAKSNVSITKNKLVDSVKKFDELLPYINTKDIYDRYYANYIHLNVTIENASNKKDEKTFNKEEHVIIIHESPSYLLICPKTFKGSVKYGSNTKWCTASKNYEGHFNSYKKGFLVYLIDKTGKRKSNYEKIAFYANESYYPNDGYNIYNAGDSSIKSQQMLSGGWTRDEIFEIDTFYRQFIWYLGDLRQAKEDVNKVISFMRNLDLNKFQENLNKLKIENTSEIDKVGETIKVFNEKFLTLNVSTLID